MLSILLAKTELIAKKRREETIRNNEWHRQYQEKLLIEKELKERKEKEFEDFKKLICQSIRWRVSRDLRDYISAYEKDAEKKNVKNEELVSWLNWANNKADWYDPLIANTDPLLNEIDRDRILDDIK